jgi:tyrosyl-tRNA synthetase
MQNIIEVLSERGLLEDQTSDVTEFLAEPRVVYAGFDPSSPSLQVGNLVAVFGLAHFQRCGHRVIALAGGATGLIGDPSGKSSERNLLTVEQVEANLAGVSEELARFLDFENAEAPAKIVNNNDWLSSFSFVEFLRDVGKHFRLGAMLNKESVRTRLESESGMSFAEFSYQLLQSYDFLHLFREEDCRLQIGGSDQWGNITAGIDLIRRLEAAPAHGITFPLVCDSNGQKFGKSEGNAIYLDPARTSCYEFYQFFVRTTDADVVRFLKLFTFLPMPEINELAEQVEAAPEKRAAQKKLAEEMTRTVHGQGGLDVALRASEVLFGGSIEGLGAEDLLAIFADVPSAELAIESVTDMTVIDVASVSGLCKSKGEARRLISGGGMYVNNVKVPDALATVQVADLVDGAVLVLRSGKKNFHLIKIV